MLVRYVASEVESKNLLCTEQVQYLKSVNCFRRIIHRAEYEKAIMEKINRLRKKKKGDSSGFETSSPRKILLLKASNFK